METTPAASPGSGKAIETGPAPDLRSMVVEQVHRIIADKTGLHPDRITAGDRFDNELGVDSLDLFEIIVAVENHFRVTIPGEEAAKMKTPGNITDWLYRNLG